MDLQLKGRTALVTGSSRGIGEAIAGALAAEGVHVVVHGRDRSKAEAVAQSIADRGGRAGVVTGDLTHEDEALHVVDEAVRQVGAIDILVNNAGGSGGSQQSWATSDAASWMAAYDRNVLAALRVSTALLPAMRREGWGRIVFISSLAAAMPPPTSPDYSASKAAMNAMVVSMAKAVASDGVTVNAISPGTIHSDALDKRFREVAGEQGLADPNGAWEDVERRVLPLFAQVPLGRVGRVEEIASAVAYLASPLAAYVTGTNLRVDGGLFPGV